MQPPRPNNHWWIPLALAATVAATTLLSLTVHEPGVDRWQDFEVYFRAAKVYFAGGDPYADRGSLPFVYSYVWLWAVRPLLALPYETAAHVALAGGAALLFVTLWIIVRAARLKVKTWVQMLALVAFLATTHQMSLCRVLETLNIESVCLFLVAVALTRYKDDRLYGALIAAAAALKPHYALFIVPGLLFERRLVPVAMVGVGLLLGYVVPFCLRPSFLPGFLTCIGQQGLEHGFYNPAPGAWLVRCLGLTGTGARAAMVLYVAGATLAYWLVMRRKWKALSPDSRLLALLLFFVLATPRLKDYSLTLLFLPSFWALRSALQFGDVWSRRLLCAVFSVGVLWAVALVAVHDPRPAFRLLSVASLLLDIAVLWRLVIVTPPPPSVPAAA